MTMVLTILSCAYLPATPTSWWNVYCPLFFWLSCLFSYCWKLRILCMFWIIALCQICDFQIFSPTCTLSYILLMISFIQQKFLILRQFSLSDFPLMYSVFSVKACWLKFSIKCEVWVRVHFVAYGWPAVRGLLLRSLCFLRWIPFADLNETSIFVWVCS